MLVKPTVNAPREKQLSVELKCTVADFIIEKVKNSVPQGTFSYPRAGSKTYIRFVNLLFDLLTGTQFKWKYIDDMVRFYGLPEDVLHKSFTVDEVIDTFKALSQSGLIPTKLSLADVLCYDNLTYLQYKRRKKAPVYSYFLLFHSPCCGADFISSLPLVVSSDFFSELCDIFRLPSESIDMYTKQQLDVVRRGLYRFAQFKNLCLACEKPFRIGMFTSGAFKGDAIEPIVTQYVEFLLDKFYGDTTSLDIRMLSVYSPYFTEFLAVKYPTQKPWMPVSAVHMLNIFKYIRSPAVSSGVVCTLDRGLPKEVIAALSQSKYINSFMLLRRKWAYVAGDRRMWNTLVSAVGEKKVPLVFIPKSVTSVTHHRDSQRRREKCLFIAT